ncbi:triple tyrosine motif-containing protein [uncultured Microscilla sp.]|uniref:triple tyrosine motif-containing protein n=1 Tax=uncultured Microscilla sp. TaxID=432653 RepID=UPI00261D7CB1|nr:triple tyrosine motif-containing protein [uncultured Microscilla sp.]
MKFLHIVLIVVSFILNINISWGQEVSDFFINHHTNKKHKILAKHCYDIIEYSNSKIIITANYYGINYLIGKKWRHHPLDNLSRLPAKFDRLVTDQKINNKYYIGGGNQCGLFYIQGDSIAYKSIVSATENKQKLGGGLVKIYQTNEKVYYLGKSSGGVIYEKLSQTKTTISPISNLNARVTYFKDQGQIYAKKQSGEVYLLRGTRWVLQSTTIFNRFRLRYYQRLDDQLAIGINDSNQVYLQQGNQTNFRPIEQLTQLIPSTEDTFIAKLKDKVIYLVVGSNLLTYHPTTKKARVLKNFNQLVLHDFTFDEQGNVWLGTSNGVVYVELRSDLKVKENTNKIYKSYQRAGVRFDIIQGSKQVKVSEAINRKPSKTIAGLGYIHNIVLQNERYFVCTQKGLYALDKETWQPTQILKGNIQNIFFQKGNDDKGMFWVIGSYGLKVFDTKLKLLAERKLKSNKSIFASILHKQNLFYSTKTELFRVKFELNKEQIQNFRIDQVKFDDKVRYDFRLEIHNDQLYIINARGLFVFNHKTGIAEGVSRNIKGLKKNKYGNYDQAFSNFLKINEKEYLISPVMLREGLTKSFPVVLNKENPQSYTMNSYGLKRIGDAYITWLYQRGDGIIELIGQDKIIEYDHSKKKEYNQPFKAFVREVSFKKKIQDSTRSQKFEDEYIYHGFTKQPKTLELPYPHNTLTFTYASDSWVAYERNLYSYQLIGLDDDWSDWSTEQKKEYTHLREGTYTFKVRCKNIYGTTSSIDSYTFTILPPWHRTAWAYALYVLAGLALLIGGSYGYSRYRSRKLYLRNQHLELVVAERTEEIKVQKETIEIANEELTKANQRLREERDEKVKIYMQEATEAANKLQKVRNTLNEKGIEAVKRMIGNEIEGVDEFAIVREKVHQEFPAFAETIDQAFIDKKVTKLVWQVGHCLKLGMSPMETGETLSISNRSVSVHGTKLRKLGILEPIKKA